MPTLLSVNNYFYQRGGAETVFLEENRMLEEREGWKVVPFAMHHPKNLETPWAQYFVDEIEFGQTYSLAGRIARVPKVIYSFEARRKLGRLLRKVRPDICHAHNIYHHISPSILGLLKRHGIPTVVTLHDLKIACPAYNMLTHDGICERCRGGRLHNVITHRCIKGSLALSSTVFVEAIVHRILGTYRRSVSSFLVPSRFYIDKLCEWGYPRSLFRYMPNFVDVSRARAQFAAGTGYVFFGRVSREKGLATLIRAGAAARCRVSIIGTGPQLDELRALAAQLNADVDFLGYLSGEDLHSAIRAARAVVLPSEWYENAPMSVLEAYALGKPVIGARIGGIPELIVENETGVTFTSGDHVALAAVLREFEARPASAVEAMGRAGRHLVEENFTADAYRARLLETFRELGVA